jgi:chitinase
MRAYWLLAAPCLFALGATGAGCGDAGPVYSGLPTPSDMADGGAGTSASDSDAAPARDAGGRDAPAPITDDAGGGPGMTTDDGGGAPSESGSPSPEAGGPDAPGSAKTDYAPYFEIGADTSAFSSLVDLQQKAGLNEVTLAFVLSGGNCSTDGTIPGAMSDINAFVAAGGHVKASFGGASGRYVEAECSDAASLAKAISDFVDATGITDLDFDIEQAPVLTDQVNMMRGQALKMVQDAKGIQVSFTLEADADPNGGLNDRGISVVTQAVAAGVKISHVNMMIMDFGQMFTGMPLAPIAIASLTDGNAQLMKIIPGLTSDQAWAMIGATPDIGKNDDGEVFSLDDAKAIAAFVVQHKLGLVAFWSIERDEVCGHGQCSGYDNADFDYHNILKTVAQ